ncbi:MAG: PaaI family thioesterase [Armatimonadota bacterium]|nr:PaaI family thioesterase [Armatimonadota bacterium]MDR7467355.1 PaaI family thioesterase [Armatimonadota bacterium]MDR7494125.1 PaaI family thioesterase [Armatimonadota bacterium]MDR7498909.1 PaaI family thioesterase [Armatimonadota bacterium]MDR7504382.1 PaaI family thioesterase [Armatimonadota bacterium]
MAGAGMPERAVQDFYPDDLAWCYGCGRLNQDGYQLKTYMEGEETVTRFIPRPYHIAVPGYVNGGVLASLIDCHGTGSAAIAAYRAAGRAVGDGPAPRYVTASLHVDYLKPTPLGVPLEVRGRIKEMKGRRVVVEAVLIAAGAVTVRGEVVAVQLPEHLMAHRTPPP